MYGTDNVQSFAEQIERISNIRELSPPIVVGGVGGSGTRLVVKVLETMGVSMGAQRNASEDAKFFVPVYDNHINKYLTGKLDAESLVSDLCTALNAHVGYSTSPNRWGWKNPRCIYLLPLLDQLFAGMSFIHVVRDGVAMSTSSNQAQLHKHGPLVIPEEFQKLSQSEQSLIHWSVVNNAAAEYGKSMSSRYLLVRYEDICNDAVAAMDSLASFLKIDRLKGPSVEITAIRTRETTSALRIGSSASLLTCAALKRFRYPC
jgi:hypothetical protein